MTKEPNIYKPINTFGYIISTLGVIQLGTAAFVIPIFPPHIKIMFRWWIVFGVIQNILWVIGGVGIVIRKAWGYYLLKLILYLLLLLIPIGTVVSVKMLEYMKKNDIKSLIFSKYIEL